MKKKKIDFESLMTKQQAANCLRGIADGLLGGNIQLTGDEGSICLSPAEIISVEISAREKKEKSKLCFEMTWCCQTVPKEV